MDEVTKAVLVEVIDHQQWQRETYGEDNEPMLDGTGPGVEWLTPIVKEAHATGPAQFHLNAREIEILFREEWDYPKEGTPEEQAAAAGSCTWMRLLREEVAEAFAQEDEERLVEELVQVAAVCVSWAATVRRRS